MKTALDVSDPHSVGPLLDELVHHCLAYCDDVTLYAGRLTNRRFKKMADQILRDRTQQALPLEFPWGEQQPHQTQHEDSPKIRIQLVNCRTDQRSLVDHAIQQWQDCHPSSYVSQAISNSKNPNNTITNETTPNIGEATWTPEDMHELLCSDGYFQTRFLFHDHSNPNPDMVNADTIVLRTIVGLNMALLAPSKRAIEWIRAKLLDTERERMITRGFSKENFSTVLRFLLHYFLFVVDDPSVERDPDEVSRGMALCRHSMLCQDLLSGHMVESWMVLVPSSTSQPSQWMEVICTRGFSHV